MSIITSVKAIPPPSLSIYLPSLAAGFLAVCIAQLGESSGIELLRAGGMAFLEIVLFLTDVKGPAACAMVGLLIAGAYVLIGPEGLRETIKKLADGVVDGFTGILGCFAGLGIGFALLGYHQGSAIIALSLIYSALLLILYYSIYLDLSNFDRPKLLYKRWIVALFFMLSGLLIGGIAYLS